MEWLLAHADEEIPIVVETSAQSESATTPAETAEIGESASGSAVSESQAEAKSLKCDDW